MVIRINALNQCVVLRTGHSFWLLVPLNISLLLPSSAYFGVAIVAPYELPRRPFTAALHEYQLPRTHLREATVRSWCKYKPAVRLSWKKLLRARLRLGSLCEDKVEGSSPAGR